ncbi:unnamed protein product, partial [Ascophyllum nodosum]
RQGPWCLRCSKLRRIGGLGGLMMTPRRLVSDYDIANMEPRRSKIHGGAFQGD